MLFSLLITNYNHAEFLEELLTSIVHQTYHDWEIIFVDDVSKDNSVQTFKKLCKQYSIPERKVVINCHETNQGYGKALMTAADLAQGDYLCIIDADDVLEISALSEIATFFGENPNCEFVYSQYKVIDTNSKALKECGTSKPLPKDHTALSYYLETKRAVISHFKVFSKRAYLASARFDPAIKKAVDQDIVFKLEEIVKPIFLNKKLYKYRMHPNQITKHNIENLTGRQWHDKVAQMATERRCKGDS